MNDDVTPQWRRNDGALIAHSVDVAACFDKRHDHVLRDIEDLLATSPNLGRLNWMQPTTYRDGKGERRPAYALTFEGFSLLVMGWTGEKALEFKIAWIEAFKAQGGVIAFATEHLPAAFNDERKLLDLIRQYGEQTGNIEDLLNKVHQMVRGIDERTELVVENVIALRGETRSRRREFSEAVKRELLWATRMLGRRCPCCGKEDVVLPAGERAPGAEFDHFFSNHFANSDSGWLICGECHYRLTHNPALRHDVTPQFKAFQNMRLALGPSQTRLFA
jgi:Rha family phage regulatory protein